MSLESLLHTLQTDTQSRITHKSKKRILHSITELEAYTLTHDQKQHVCFAATALRRRHRNGLKGYKSLSEQLYTIGGIHTPLYTPIYEELIHSRKHYTTRFRNITQNLDHMSAQEAMLCMDEIQSNAYLRRKASTNAEFAVTQDRLITALEQHIHYVHKQTKPKRTFRTFMYALAGAAWAAAYTYAISPL